jgi:hypothetical protein
VCIVLKRLFVAGTAVAAAAAWAGFVSARTLWRTWGIVPEDQVRVLPGDELVADAEGVDTRSLEIQAPPERVWPWLVQMGYGRGGWYSYDQLDMNHPSLDHVAPELQSLAPGDVVPTHPAGGFEVKVLEPERALVLYADRDLMLAQAERAGAGGPETGRPAEATPANLRATGAALEQAMPGDFRASWAFVLDPTTDGRTRLVERFRVTMAPADPARPVPPFIRTLLGFGVFVMTRRQMLGIRDRVEGRPLRSASLPCLAARRRPA